MTCIEHLWPLLINGGAIFSQDGQLTDVVNAMADANWWQEKFQRQPPFIFGAGHSQLIFIAK